MSQAIAGGTFDPATQSVAARGTFNSWAAFPLTNNPAGTNTALYTGTTNVAGNATVMQYKYTVEPGAHYEAVALGGSHNRLITLPTASGASLVLPKVYYGDAPPEQVTTSVSFRVDLAQQINTGAFKTDSSLVYARGSFNSWTADNAMTNAPGILVTNQYGLVTSNVYVQTYDVTGSPGQTVDYKYYIDTGSVWESPTPGTGDPVDNNNRFFNLGEGPSQTLPIIAFNDAPYAPVATNLVTFQVDMSAQVLAGNFDPASGTVEVRGNFNSWGTPASSATNDLSATNTNLYRAVVRIVDGVGAQQQYKFWASVPANSGWETIDNRVFRITNAPTVVLPVAFFNNLDPADLLSQDTVVRFTVSMTNAVGTDAHVFDPAMDQVFINGVPAGFVTWDASLPELTNNPTGSRLYSIELTLPKGSSIQQTYKYSINGTDNEAAVGANHVRFVRTEGTYQMPPDTFGVQYAEPSFGQLSANRAPSSSVSISWLGRPGVHLQTTGSLVAGPWNDLLDTDGATWTTGHSSTNGFISVTNYPASGSPSFFRLVK